MSKSQNTSMRNRKRQVNTTPQKVNNHITKDLKDSSGDETLISELKRMIIRVTKGFKVVMSKHINKIQKDMNRLLNELMRRQRISK
jgi:hypothetical protein